MMASGIIFFAGATPPYPKGFLLGTLCSATVSTAMLSLLTGALPPVAVQGAATGALLMWYKSTACIFPPAAVLAGLMSAAASSGTSNAAYLAFPWLSGHACLYTSAMAFSTVRATMREKFAKSKLRLLKTMSDEQLKGIFDK